MSDITHIHEDDLIVDADEHFTIDTVSRLISNDNNKKIRLIQYDNKSERYSFDIDRTIDGHDLIKCNRIQVHFINKKHPGLYLVEDAHVNPSDDTKFTFSWLISNDATQYTGELQFLISFECVDYDYINEHGENIPKILYRWSTAIYKGIQIVDGMDNDNVIAETYNDELLTWQNKMAVEVIPDLVDECYVEREFATSDEVAAVFDLADSGEYTPSAMVSIDSETITKNSDGELQAVGIKNGNTIIHANQVVTEEAVNTMLDDYAEKSYVDSSITTSKASIKEELNATLDDYAKQSYVDSAITTSKTAVKEEINDTLGEYAKQSYVDSAIQQAILNSWGGSY